MRSLSTSPRLARQFSTNLHMLGPHATLQWELRTTIGQSDNRNWLLYAIASIDASRTVHFVLKSSLALWGDNAGCNRGARLLLVAKIECSGTVRA